MCAVLYYTSVEEKANPDARGLTLTLMKDYGIMDKASMAKEDREMKAIQVRGLEIGNGIPKICAPIVGSTPEQIKAQAQAIAGSPAQIAEWRCDFAEDGIIEAPEEMLAQLRSILGEKLLLVTFRTKPEGGAREISPEAYKQFCESVLGSGQADLLDLELTAGDSLCNEIIREAAAAGVHTVISCHFFDRTPASDELRNLMLRMERSGASILKLAVMPQDQSDVLRLMQECHAFSEKTVKPMIFMSMGKMGLMSRLSGELTDSCITFGTVGEASAPGQIDVKELDRILRIVHGE